MKHVLAIPFAAFVSWLVAWAAGKWLFHILQVKLYRSEERFLCFVSGSALLSLVVFLLTAAHLAYTAVFVAAGAVILAAAWHSGALRRTAGSLPPMPRMWSAVFWIAYAAYGWFYLASAMRPEASPDGLVYHVAFPAQYLREHGFPAQPRNMLMHLSQGMEMLYLFAFSIGRHSAPAMVHLLFTLLTPLGLLDYGRRMGRPEAGAVAGLLFFLSPIVGRDGTVPYLDVGVAAILFAAFYVLEIWREESSTGAPLIAGLLGGFAYAVKYTAGLAALYVLGYVLFHLWRGKRPVLRAASAVCLAAAFMILPWAAKNYALTGNPFAPFGNALFPNPAVYVSSERAYVEHMSAIGDVTPAQIPLEVTVRGSRLQGMLGPVFILTPLLLLGLHSPAGRRLAFAALFFSLTYPAAIACRFLIPPLPFVSMALALVLTHWPAVGLLVTAINAVLCWPSVVVRYAEPYAWLIEDKPYWSIALRQFPEEEYLRTNVVDYTMGRILEKQVPAGEAILTLGPFQTTYHQRQIVTSWTTAAGVRLGEALRTPTDPELMPTQLYSLRFGAKTLRGIRLMQKQAGEQDWTVTELRFYLSGVEIPRQPAWRLNSKPNPWDAPLAFDANPVTRWTSGAQRRPGMFLEADFGTEVTLDEVRVLSSDSNMAVTIDSSGTTVSQTQVAAPAYLRSAAVEYLRQNGIRWLLLHELDPPATDIQRRTARWGFELVAAEGRYRLYRVKLPGL